MKDELLKKLRVFGLGQLQDLVTLSDILQREGASLGDVKEFLKEKSRVTRESQEAMRKVFDERRKLWNSNTRSCPECKKPLGLRVINTPKGKSNREGYTCHWFCQEEDCLFEQYTHEDFKETYSKIMGG